MDFTIFPFAMIALCAVMMFLMMGGMRCMHGGHRAMVSSGKMGCFGLSFGPWAEQTQRPPSPSWRPQQPTSGNQAFDEYRAETLRRLEKEQRDFQDFLARLRLAKDKAEFDEFMGAGRGQREPQPPA
jgi:hypothetical protein